MANQATDPVHKPRGAMQPPHGAIYTCPMHPEIRQSTPGVCPKCGMALEEVTTTQTAMGIARPLQFGTGACCAVARHLFWRGRSDLRIGLRTRTVRQILVFHRAACAWVSASRSAFSHTSSTSSDSMVRQARWSRYPARPQPLQWFPAAPITWPTSCPFSESPASLPSSPNTRSSCSGWAWHSTSPVSCTSCPKL